MRHYVLTFLLVILGVNGWGQNQYYVSPTGDDNLSGLSEALAWQSLTKVNAEMGSFQPGDIISFERGGSFAGSLVLTAAGNATQSITFNAYGSGDKPIIHGKVTLGTWTAQGGNIWKVACPSCRTDRLPDVFLDGVKQTLGRYPNADATNAGYLTMDATYQNSQLTDTDLPNTPNWTGAEVVVRSSRWTLDHVPVASHQNGGIINFGQAVTYYTNAGYGYFFQNHLSTLDQEGEWYFDQTNKEIYLYTTTNPNTVVSEASIELEGLDADGAHYVEISNLCFEGYLDANISLRDSDHLRFTQNEVRDGGEFGVFVERCDQAEITSNLIEDINNTGLWWIHSHQGDIQRNNFRRIGTVAGRGENGTLKMSGIIISDWFQDPVGENLFQYNTLENIGYNGISCYAENTYIRNNNIRNFCMTVDDGSGIYAWSQNTNNPLVTGTEITQNIILYGIGAGAGTNQPDENVAHGIYMDNGAADVLIQANTAGFCDKGIVIHNANNIQILNNTLFANYAQLLFERDSQAPNEYDITNCVVQNNILASIDADQFCLYQQTYKNDIASMATFSNNCYISLFPDIQILRGYNATYPSGSIQKYYLNFEEWQDESGQDVNSSVIFPRHEAYTLVSQGPNLISNSFLDGGANEWFNWAANHVTNSRSVVGALEGLDGNTVKFITASTNGSGNLNAQTWHTGVDGLKASKQYQYRFSARANDLSRVQVGLRMSNSPWADIAGNAYITLSDERKDIVSPPFSPDQDEAFARMNFHWQSPDAPTTLWLDNIECYEVVTTPRNAADYYRLEVNATEVSSQVTLSGDYYDAKGQVYCDGEQITLAPYTSKLLYLASDSEAPSVYDLSYSRTQTFQVLGCGNQYSRDPLTKKSLLAIDPQGQNLGNTQVQTFMYSGAIRTYTDDLYTLNRSWAITPEFAPASPVGVCLYFTQGEYDALAAADVSVSSVNDLRVVRYSPNVAGTEDGDPTNNTQGTMTVYTPTITSVDGGYCARFETDGFSEFFLTGSSTLPVEWLEFTAVQQGAAVVLDWKTAREVSSSYFDVERSADGRLFGQMGTVEAAGFTNEVTAYHFVDSDLKPEGSYYYRLRQVDIDGSFSYSDIREVQYVDGEAQKIRAYPNPVVEKLQIEIESNESPLIRLCDARGRVLHVQRHTDPIGMDTYPPGIYTLQVVTHARTHFLKVLKK